jgi:small subunit ribosomal protein S18
MPRKTHTDRKDRSHSSRSESRTPRPKPKIDFTIEALDFRNSALLKNFVTDQGRLLPRKYTNLPAHYQRRLTRMVKRARAMLMAR